MEWFPIRFQMELCAADNWLRTQILVMMNFSFNKMKSMGSLKNQTDAIDTK